MTDTPRPGADELFDQAVELPASERTAFLERACAGDPELRREVEGLLAADGRAGEGFLSGPADLRALAGTLAEQTDTAPGEGDEIGAWRLLRRLGVGGMGAVHLAERTAGGFAQRVAVKLVRPGLDGDEILERFRHERQLLARLEHPHIARLIDGGRTPGGAPYLVMEFVDGKPIDAYCAKRRLDTPARLRLFLDVCAAVAHAHRHLVVHRDLKPGNVLVTGDGQVKLLDFGIAKVLGGQERDASLTLTGARLFSPRYASPEHVAGQPVTTATDVYSLGVILYELLTGRSPYPATDGSLPELERQIREHRPAAPSAAGSGSSGSSGCSVDADLDAIVLQALRKEPERRYAGVDALADDVRRYLDGRPVQARPDSLRYRAGKFMRRHRPAMIVGAAAAILVIAAATVGVVQSRRAERQQRAAAQIGAFLQTTLASLDPEVAHGQDTTLLRGLLDRAAESLANDPALDDRAAADLHATIGRTYAAIAEYDRARPHLVQALALRGDAAGRRAARYDLGRLLHDAGRYDEAEAALRSALAEDGAHPPDALLRYHLGKVLEATDRVDEAEPLLRGAVAAMSDQSDQAGVPERPAVVAGLGLFLMYNRQAYAEAESLLVAALELCPTTPGSPVLEPPTIRLALSTLYRYTGDPERATELGRAALTGYAALLPPHHPTLANAQDQLASILAEREAWDEAETLYREAYASLRSSLGPDHRDVGTTANNLAGLLRKRERPDEAAPFYDEALRIYRTSLGPDHSWVGIILGGIAANELARGDFAAAEALADTCLRIRRATFGPDHWRVAIVENLRGVCLAARGEREQAARLLRSSRDVLAAALGPEHPATRIADERWTDFQSGESPSPSPSSRR